MKAGFYLFSLHADVLKNAANYGQRENVLDQLLIGGACAARPKGNPELAELRHQLLSTYLDDAKRERYRYAIWWCPCHVQDKDITVGQRTGTFSCRIVDESTGESIKFLSLKETEDRLLPSNMLPTLRNATPHVKQLATDNTAMLSKVVSLQQHQVHMEANFSGTEEKVKTLEAQLQEGKNERTTIQNQLILLKKQYQELCLKLETTERALAKMVFDAEHVGDALFRCRQVMNFLEVQASKENAPLSLSEDTLQSIYQRAEVRILGFFVWLGWV